MGSTSTSPLRNFSCYSSVVSGMKLGARLDRRVLLVFALVLIVAGWQFEVGRLLLYPFTLLATYAHEMGHGTTALLMGGSLDSLELFPNGSGLAKWRGDVGRLGRAFIALGGLVGPSLLGAFVLVVSRRSRRAPLVLIAMSVILCVSALLWVRTIFGFALLLAFAALFLVVARKGPQRVAPFLVQLVAANLCLSVFRDVSYMFSDGGVIDGVPYRSDSATIADALWLPYWFWGGIAAFVAFSAMAYGLKHAFEDRSVLDGPAPMSTQSGVRDVSGV